MVKRLHIDMKPAGCRSWSQYRSVSSDYNHLSSRRSYYNIQYILTQRHKVLFSKITKAPCYANKQEETVYCVISI